jgi:hypothetical protein
VGDINEAAHWNLGENFEEQFGGERWGSRDYEKCSGIFGTLFGSWLSLKLRSRLFGVV